MALSAAAQPDVLDVKVCRHYKYHADRTAGREILLTCRDRGDVLGANHRPIALVHHDLYSMP